MTVTGLKKIWVCTDSYWPMKDWSVVPTVIGQRKTGQFVPIAADHHSCALWTLTHHFDPFTVSGAAK